VKTLENWIDQRQSKGSYTFLRSEAYGESGLSEEAGKKALQRLAEKGRITKVKNYFYVIVPLEYAQAKSPPASWFIDNLMHAMNAPYYVGLLSAAAQYGAAHHAPQEFQVISNRYIRPLEIGRTRIHFFTSKFADAAVTQATKTPTGTMRVSTVETTVVDLVRFAKSAGQLDNVASVIGELTESIVSKKLLDAVKIVNDLPNSQRLGFILDHLGARNATNDLRRWVENQYPKPVPLRTGSKVSKLPENKPWRVAVDLPLEIET